MLAARRTKSAKKSAQLSTTTTPGNLKSRRKVDANKVNNALIETANKRFASLAHEKSTVERVAKLINATSRPTYQSYRWSNNSCAFDSLFEISSNICAK